MNSDIMIELEGIQEYGQNMLRNRVNTGENNSDIAMFNELKLKLLWE